MSAELAPPEPINAPPSFSGTSWEDHVSSWFEISEAVESAQWMRGAIVASLETKYGEASVEKFAGEVMLAARTLRQYRQIYEFYKNGVRSPFLSWKHHLVAMYAPDAEAALRLAEDEGLSAASLARRIKVLVPPTGDEVPLLKGAHVSHNSGENEWYTPPDYIERARKVMGGIDLDPATSEKAQEVVRADRYFTIESDGLSQKWAGRVWMNPPYASGLVEPFTAKLADSYREGDVTQALALVNNATDTAWFQYMAAWATSVLFIRGRIRFHDREGNASGAPLQGQALVYFGDDAPGFAQAFGDLGLVLYL